MEIKDLSTLKLNVLLSDAQYLSAHASGKIEDEAFYLVPEEDHYSKLQVNDKFKTHNTSDSAHEDIRALIKELTARLDSLTGISDEATSIVSEGKSLFIKTVTVTEDDENTISLGEQLCQT